MNENKKFNPIIKNIAYTEDRNNIDSNFEAIKKMTVDWRLEDDDEIKSFSFSDDFKLLNYSVSDHKEKSWDIQNNRVKRNFPEQKKSEEKQDVVANFNSKYGALYPVILHILKERTESVRDNINNEQEYIEWIIKNSEITPVDSSLFIMVPGSIAVDMINLKTQKHIVLHDEEKTSVPESVISWSEEKNVAIKFENCVKIFDTDNGDCLATFSDVDKIGESQSEDEAIFIQRNGIINIADKKSYAIKKSFDCNLKDYKWNISVFEIKDGKFIVYADSQEVGIIDKKSGEIIKKIQGKYPTEDPRSGLTVLNENKIEFWRFDGARGKEPVNIIIKDNEILNEYQRFCEFKEENFALKTGEETPDAYWNQCSNLEAERLNKKGEFKWSQERIYFHVKSDDFVKLSNLIKHIAGQNDIAISFKYYDVEKNGQPKKDDTRFATNFSSVADAKKLYEKLAVSKEYQNMAADEETDYLSYKLDEKAYYSSGYREDRRQELNNAEKYIKNPDGTYTFIDDKDIQITESGDKNIQITESEYIEKMKAVDFSTKFKKIWDDGLLKNKSTKKTINSNMKEAFNLKNIFI